MKMSGEQKLTAIIMVTLLLSVMIIICAISFTEMSRQNECVIACNGHVDECKIENNKIVSYKCK